MLLMSPSICSNSSLTNRHMALLTEGGTGPALSSIHMALLTEGTQPRRGTISAGLRYSALLEID